MSATNNKSPGSSATVRTKRPLSEIDTIDLTSDDDGDSGIGSVSPEKRQKRNSNDQASTIESLPLLPVGQLLPIEPAATPTQSAAVAAPTPDPTPEKKKSLYDIPEIADKYVAVTSTAEGGIEYKNPARFSLKPAFYAQWHPKFYRLFAEHLRYQFDPIPFAQQYGLTVEEVRHVFTGIVVNPLYCTAEATKRGNQAVQDLISLYKDCGTDVRPWGKTQQVQGELSGVAMGSVQLVLEDGSKTEMGFDGLSEFDKKYLQVTLSAEDKILLWDI